MKVTGETTWDRPIMAQDDLRREQQQQVKQPNQRSSGFSNDYQNNNNNEEEQSEEEEGAEEDSVDESLPSDWIPLVDPASGDTYFCNEVTGEVTWDKPQFDPEEEEKRQSSRGQRRPQDKMDKSEEGEESSQLLDSEQFKSEDGTEDDDPASVDDELPEGWFLIVDPASGDVYYSNEITGETTW
jgi:hypothetical protein